MLGEKIELVLVKRKMSKSDLARALNTSPSNLYNKFSRDNFSEKEMEEIAAVLNCIFEAFLTLNDTNEQF